LEIDQADIIDRLDRIEGKLSNLDKKFNILEGLEVYHSNQRKMENIKGMISSHAQTALIAYQKKYFKGENGSDQ